MPDINIKLDVFEGPLDLLLHLIKKLEIDIYDIPISEITSQYMQYIETMQTLALDVAGEYLVMAATLMAIKSQMLLPTQVMEEEPDLLFEGEDPRAALVEQLLEYRKFKYAAEVLKEKHEERSLYFTTEPVNLDAFKTEMVPLKPHQFSAVDLFTAFHQLLERRQKRRPKETTIAGESITVEEKMTLLTKKLEALAEGQVLTFDSLFENCGRGEIVTTFMAMLELMKAQRIQVEQLESYGPIYLSCIKKHENQGGLAIKNE